MYGSSLLKLKMKVVYLRVAIFGLRTLLVAGQTPTSNWAWKSKPAPPACTSCAVAAKEFYLSYPYSISTVATPVIVTIVPYITSYDDGSQETNWRTETRGSNGPDSVNGPLGTQEPKLTWEPYSGVTLTYPTTYVNFPSPYGGLDILSNGACVTATTPLTLPTNSEQGLIYPVTKPDWDTRLPWNVTQQMLDYLDSIPAISQQFHGTKVESCEWATYVSPTSKTLPITKITVQYLTARTAQAVIVTRKSAPASTSVNLSTTFTRNIPTTTSTSTTSAITSPTSTSTPSATTAPTILSVSAPISGGTQTAPFFGSSFGPKTAVVFLLFSFSRLFQGFTLCH
ncbi:putative dipeptidyl peptidase 4 [Venturia nashicola]|uniref:Putative dipeptidyl peptidase 4 n=1 Tax=Venturia nashicola TaxID=86259 RepID=A0A4Z1P184_9PEZI|nr:putative dipeptidyl peptidase 4 [Venturia nashicola]TLD27516.1 putative dipeptidyl peptidase 4 [Venturia nashicola]